MPTRIDKNGLLLQKAPWLLWTPWWIQAQALVITMVFVSVSETYDLSTKANKMTLIGIHTPSRDIIQKTYPGLCMNSKYCRIVKQDVVLACASTMPFSADIVGTGADDVSPADVFNPILYKAVSNDSMSNIEARLAGLASSSAFAFDGPSVRSTNDSVTELSDEFNVYYSLLSNRDGFRTASPQQGLQMRNLVPLVFEKYYNYGVNQSGTLSNDASDAFPVHRVVDGAGTIGTMYAAEMRGRPHPMPRFNTTYLTGITTDLATGINQNNGIGDGHPRNSQTYMPTLMPVYTACIIMPPSKLHSLYFRLVVRTYLEFTEVRPITEVASFQELNSTYASLVYASDYDTQSKSMTKLEGMVDVKDGDLEKIMEGA